MTPSDPVYARTQQIIAAVPNPCSLPAVAPIVTLTPPSATNQLPGGEQHTVTVNVTLDGNPLAGQVVNLTTTFGTLNVSSVTTDATGAATFTVTSNAAGTATITASLSYVLPAGTRFTALPGAPDQQVLVLGTPQTGNVTATATKTWATGSIVVHKFHDENLNQVQDGTEASLSGWSMKLQRFNGTNWVDVATLSTNASGNAIFTPLAAGTYRAVETMQSGWQASTPNPSAQIVLPLDGVGQIDFGNFRLPAIKIWKFHDLNGNGVKDANEPTLDGWEMNIQPAINGIGSCTTVGGFCAFQNLSVGAYVVTETMQPGWSTTTGASQTINVTANSVAEVWVGNAQLDWGDLPDPAYPTLSANNGPRHAMTPALYLGACVDGEADGQPNATATGDDVAVGNPVFGNAQCTDDEDGVTLVTPLVAGQQACVAVTAHNATGAPAVLQGWIDFNGNGSLADAGDALAFTPNALVPNGGVSNQQYCFNVPAGATFAGGQSAMRFRLSSAGGLGFTGVAPDGEVEDYQAPVACVGNLVWSDLNKNGIQDDGAASAFSGIAVNMVWAGPNGVINTPDGNTTPSGDDIVYAATTDSSGLYRFCGVLLGTYQLKVVAPPAGVPYASAPSASGSTAFNDSNGVQASAGAPSVIPPFTITNIAGLPTSENGMNDGSPMVSYPDVQENRSYDFGFQDQPPLAVALASFAAQAQTDHVLVTWETVSELNNAGFNLYRSDTVGGVQTLLANVASQAPGGTSGAMYSHIDSAVTAGETYWYWLEAVDLNGATTMFEPVSVTFQTPTAVTLSGLSADAGSSGTLFLLLATVALVVLAAVYARFRRVSAS